jgi:flagellar motor switch protein FliM
MAEEVESEDSESSRKLTQEEVNALISGLDDQVDQANPNSGSKDADVREFDFGSDDLSLLGDYYALRVINERFARMARAVFFADA